MNQNPFDRFGLDPLAPPDQLTARLRELAEDASSSDREAIRAVWEELTLHPRRRVLAALDAFPGSGDDGVETGPEVTALTVPAHETSPLDRVTLPSLHAALFDGPLPPPAGAPPLSADPLLDDEP